MFKLRLSYFKSLVVFILFLPVIMLATSSASGGTITIEDGCMGDLFGKKLNCTANDVRVAEAIDIVVTDPP